MCLGGTCFILFLCNLSREIQILIIFICSYFVDLLSGTYCLLSYASFIFDEAGSSLSPNVSAIILGSIQMFGVYFSTILVDRTGRKFLMISSAICCSLGLALFSIYDYLKHSEMDVTGYNWVPLASCAFVIFVANLGTTNLINCRFSTIFNFFFLHRCGFVTFSHPNWSDADKNQWCHLRIQFNVLMVSRVFNAPGKLRTLKFN